MPDIGSGNDSGAEGAPADAHVAALDALAEIEADPTLEERERLRALLDLATRHLGLTQGLLAVSTEDGLRLEARTDTLDASEAGLAPEALAALDADTEPLCTTRASAAATPWPSWQAALGWESGILVPVPLRDKTLCVVAAGDSAPRFTPFDSGEIAFLRRAAGRLARILDQSAAIRSWSETVSELTGRLFETEDLMTQIVDSADEAIITLDNELRIIQFNRGAEAMFGRRAGDVQGWQVARLWPAADAGATTARLLEAATAPGEVPDPDGRVEITGIRANGQTFPAEVAVLSLVSVQQQARHTLLLRDLTTRKETEAALEHARRQSERANRAKSQFLATISHELRTPLNAVIGFAEMLETQSLGPLGQSEYVEFAHTIRESGEGLLASINDIIDLSRLEVGTLSAQTTEVAPRRVVETVAKSFAEEARRGGQTLEVALPDGLPEVVADPRQLPQILRHLVGNALRHTPVGTRVTLAAEVASDGSVALMVRDDGPGIPADRLNVVMTPFAQGDDTFSRAQGGTGLGLPLARALAELQGARLELDSAPGDGTEARVVFPPVPGEPVPAAAETGAAETGASSR